MSSCIIYQNEERTVILLDIPRSIELAQGTPKEPRLRRLISCEPLEKPFPSVEPKSAKAKAKLGETPLKSLLLQKHIQISLEELKNKLTGPWHLPRVTSPDYDGAKEPSFKKLKTETSISLPSSVAEESETLLNSSLAGAKSYMRVLPVSEFPEFYQNESSTAILLKVSNPALTNPIYIPPNSTFINRLITTPESFQLPNNESFPDSKLNLILLDPPWPNRSVKRKQNYSISSNTPTIQTLLTTIPIPSLLSQDGIVALWITNKPAFHDLILDPEEGIFKHWGLELVEEWVWVKITKDGEPMCEIDGAWRKPYEVLLLARRIPSESVENEGSRKEKGVKRRVIFAVPDIHSRKPNLKELFEGTELLGRDGGYEALEIFARNLTAGWWAWGNEVLEFQKDEYWV